METGQRNDPYRSYNFEIQIDDIPVMAFSECSGLVAEGDAVDYREGTDLTPIVRKLVGLRKTANVVLKNGYGPQSQHMWQWFKNILNGVPDRRNVTIVLLDSERRPVLRWHLDQAWINKIEGPSLKASSSEVAMLSMELVHEGITLE
jgi:phage tail-like protein